MKVLVTGATGGLGKLIVKELLKRNVTVIISSRNSDRATELEFINLVTYKSYDISEKNETINLFKYFNEPDLLIHLAWENLNNFKTDLHLSKTLGEHKIFLSNLINNGLKNITVTGTCYEYGLQEGMLTESLSSLPTLPYAKAKDQLREFLEDKQDFSDLDLKWIRVFYVFGEVEGRKNLYTLLNTMINNKETSFNMSGGQQVRDFLTPQEIAEKCVSIALQNKVFGIINCCSGKPVKLLDLVNNYLNERNYKVKLNLGYYPYPDYEPMETWGDTKKLNDALTTEKNS